MARRYDEDDDWDDIEEVEIEEEEPGILTTARILVGLLLVIFAAIVVGRLVLWEKPEFTELTPRLFGIWTTTHPDFTDQYVEFRRDTVIFGTGGTGVVKFKILGMDADKVGDNDHYTVLYRDLAGTKHYLDMLLEESGEILRLTDNAEARWVRYEMPE